MTGRRRICLSLNLDNPRHLAIVRWMEAECGADGRGLRASQVLETILYREITRRRGRRRARPDDAPVIAEGMGEDLSVRRKPKARPTPKTDKPPAAPKAQADGAKARPGPDLSTIIGELDTNQ